MNSKYRKSVFPLWLMAAISVSSATGRVEKAEQSRTNPAPKTVLNLWHGVAPGSEQWKRAGDLSIKPQMNTEVVSALFKDIGPGILDWRGIHCCYGVN